MHLGDDTNWVEVCKIEYLIFSMKKKYHNPNSEVLKEFELEVLKKWNIGDVENIRMTQWCEVTRFISDFLTHLS